MSGATDTRSGQAALEYILLLAILVGFFLIVSGALKQNQLAQNLTKPISDEFRRSYQFGSPRVKGIETEDVEFHPRVSNGNNFRIFINPE